MRSLSCSAFPTPRLGKPRKPYPKGYPLGRHPSRSKRGSGGSPRYAERYPLGRRKTQAVRPCCLPSSVFWASQAAKERAPREGMSSKTTSPSSDLRSTAQGRDPLDRSARRAEQTLRVELRKRKRQFILHSYLIIT